MTIAVKNLLSVLLTGGVLGAAAMPAAAVTVTTDELGGNDGTVIYTGRDQNGAGTPAASSWGSATSGTSGGIIGVSGSFPNRTTSVFVMAFRLPELPSGMEVGSAQLDVYLRAINASPAFNADLWGLGYASSSALVTGTLSPNTTGQFNDPDGDGDPGVGTAVQFSDTTDLGSAYGIASRVKLADNMITTSSSLTTLAPDTLNVISASGASLAAFIQSLYDNGAVGGASGDFVFLRLSPDADINAAGGSYRYQMWTNNDSPTAGSSIIAPALTIEFVPIPEPAAVSLMSLGGGLILRRRH